MDNKRTADLSYVMLTLIGALMPLIHFSHRVPDSGRLFATSFNAMIGLTLFSRTRARPISIIWLVYAALFAILLIEKILSML